MKYLITILLLLTTIFSNSYAENWLNHSKIKSGSVEAYSLKADCERISGEKCYDLGENKSSLYSEVDVEVDDNSKPMYSKNEIQSCLNIEQCDSLHSVKICSNELESSIKNYDSLEVYCSRFLGYEKKLEKQMQLDSQKLSEWQAQEAVKAQLGLKEASIQGALKRIECGKRVIGLLIVRNAVKPLTTAHIAQINSVYAPIKGLIDTGSLNTAKEQMEAIVPDGFLITETDKSELVQEINKCL